MDSQPAPPEHIVDVILKTAASQQSTSIRFVSEQDTMSIQFLTGTTWQEDMKIPIPLDSMVVAEMWTRIRHSEGMVSLHISPSKSDG